MLSVDVQSDEVLYLYTLRESSKQYRSHKYRYWCQCKSV